MLKPEPDAGQVHHYLGGYISSGVAISNFAFSFHYHVNKEDSQVQLEEYKQGMHSCLMLRTSLITAGVFRTLTLCSAFRLL